jgi:hypothetical protein
VPARLPFPKIVLALPRFTAVGITTLPALRKFTQYHESVTQFEVFGLPWSEVAVLLTTHGTEQTFGSPATIVGQLITEGG